MEAIRNLKEVGYAICMYASLGRNDKEHCQKKISEILFNFYLNLF